MNPVCCFSLFLLLHLTGAKSVPDLQSLKQILEDFNTAPYYSSEEMEREARDGRNKSEFGAPEKHSWDWESSDPSNSALPAEENVLMRLFKDLMRTSKRASSRYKKGGLRSCFGVRLERIGSFSGLGC
uniref:natriuretic peptide A-like n=1 Tax=Solea senegalensis TaxID=28829 RepID=UPI001CD8C5B6|nr:natriuretic peptide A-like [Solea senegalensis]XP_043894859.1 natriuretic peptide A-like [Solea senegalensis]